MMVVVYGYLALLGASCVVYFVGNFIYGFWLGRKIKSGTLTSEQMEFLENALAEDDNILVTPDGIEKTPILGVFEGGPMPGDEVSVPMWGNAIGLTGYDTLRVCECIEDAGTDAHYEWTGEVRAEDGRLARVYRWVP